MTEEPPDAEVTRVGNGSVEWDALKLEYRMLRGEIQSAIKNQVQILGYGGAALSVVLGAGLIQESALVVATLPLLAFFFFVLWNVEQTRMMRAGDYLYGVEKQIDATADAPTMRWETWLRDRNENGEPEPVAPRGFLSVRDVYRLHYHSQLLVQMVFVLVILGGIAAVWLWPPTIPGLEFGVWAQSTLTVLYGSFLLAAAYLLWGTLRHNAEREVERFRGLDVDE
jgi:hypothetical protein